MTFTSFSMYSLLLLIETAKKNSELLTIRKFSVNQDISYECIRIVVQFLSMYGYIETYGDKGSAFKLCKNARDINIGELLRLTESISDVTKNGAHSVSDNIWEEACNSNEIFKEAFEAMFSVYEKYTLADLFKNDRSLKLIKSEMEFSNNKISYG